MTCVEALDDWFTFVDGKSQYYLRRTSSLAHFSRGQLVMWKLVCATIVYVFLHLLCAERFFYWCVDLIFTVYVFPWR